MIRPGQRTLPFIVALVAGLWAGPAGATNIVGSKIQAKSPPKFQVQSKDPLISPALPLNPDSTGATLEVFVGGVLKAHYDMPGSPTMCSGVPCWSGDNATGFKYKNSLAPAGGQVKGAQVKFGKLKIKAVNITGDSGPGFPLGGVGTADVIFTFTAGSVVYCAKFIDNPAAGDPTKNDVTQYLNKNKSVVTGSCPCADCCGAGFTKIKTVNGVPSSTVVGHVLDDSGASLLDLTSGGLYFGGSGVGVPLPSPVPDTLPDANGFAGTYTKISACSAGNFTILPAALADVSGSVHPARHCSVAGVANGVYATPKDGCLFGPPLAIPNTSTPATSTCVVNRVSTNAGGTGKCDGTTTLSLPLASDIYLTGPTDGLVPCPRCTSGTCSAGPNSGQPCVPEDSASISAANPTSHDCPPASAAFVGSLPIGFNLSTGTQTKTSVNFSAQPFVFYGFCGKEFSPNFEGELLGPGCACCANSACDSNVCTGFGAMCTPVGTCTGGTGDCVKGPAHACTADGTCSTDVRYPKCRQRFPGAFGQGPARTITTTGVAPGCLTDGAAHPLTLISVFGIPPAFDSTVDGAGDLPGPGATSLPGTTQLIP
jgi:hypothetical protein